MLDDVAAAPDELALWELMSQYNWDDGFAVPLAVIQHPACDRGLALRMFWELDDAGQTHYLDEDSGLREGYVVEVEHDPEEFGLLVAYSTALVDGLRNGKFQRGCNRFDTGFFNLDDPELSERQGKLRAGLTKRAQLEFEEEFLRPEL